MPLKNTPETLNILDSDFRMPEHCGGDHWSILHGAGTAGDGSNSGSRLVKCQGISSPRAPKTFSPPIAA